MTPYILIVAGCLATLIAIQEEKTAELAHVHRSSNRERLLEESLTAQAASFLLLSQSAGMPSTFKVPARSAYDVSLASDGTIYVVDGKWPRLIALSSTGTVLWQHSQKGIGPNEMLVPYRVALDINDAPVVLDIGAKNLLWFRRNGEFARRTNLGLAFTMVSDIAILADGTVVVAGVSTDSRAKGYALHFFTNELAWIRSGIRLRSDLTSDIQTLWGVGSLERSSPTSVLFSPRAPGGVLEVGVDGTVIRRIPVDDSGLTNPSAYFRSRVSKDNVRSSYLADTLVAPGRAFPLSNGHILTSKIAGAKIIVVEHGANGAPLATRTIGVGDYLPFAFDSVACRFYIHGRGSGDLTLGHVSLRPAQSTRERSNAGGSTDAKTLDGVGCANSRNQR